MPGRLITTASADVALKGLAYLLEAMAKLRTERDVTLTIIGKPKTGKSMDLIDKLGLRPHIDFVSGVPDERIVELYAEAELAVVPSLYEGFSLPAIEAMCTGIPLVATDGGALPEVTGTDGDTVLQCPAGDAGALAAAIARGLDDPALRARVGAAGRRRVVDTVELATLRRDDRRPVPRGAGDAAQRREAATERPRLSAHDPLRQARPAPRRPRARRRRRLRPPRVRGRSARRSVVALDYAADEVAQTRATVGAMVEAGEITVDDFAGVLRGDATRLPFADGSFDVVITSEVLEHIQDDVAAIAEMVRVLAPGGTFAATVPSWFPEKINWMLSDEYHAPKSVGGHVRIYSRTELRAKLRAAGLDVTASHHAHALHSPYWWLRCPSGRNGRPQVGRPLQAVPRVGHRRATPQHADRRPGAVARARQERRALRHASRLCTADCDRCRRGRSRRMSSSLPDIPGVLSADEIRVTGDHLAALAAALRHDPVVRGRALRSVEPRRVGDGARRRRPSRRSGLGLRLAGRHPAPRRQLAQLLPVRRHGRGTQARHQRVRLHRHRRVASLALHRRTRAFSTTCGRPSNGRSTGCSPTAVTTAPSCGPSSPTNGRGTTHCSPARAASSTRCDAAPRPVSPPGSSAPDWVEAADDLRP